MKEKLSGGSAINHPAGNDAPLLLVSRVAVMYCRYNRRVTDLPIPHYCVHARYVLRNAKCMILLCTYRYEAIHSRDTV